MIFLTFLICLTQESMWLGLVDHQKKTKIAFSNWNPLGNDLQYVARPFISRNSSCPKSRLLCTQKKRIWTTDSTKQSKKRSEFIGLRNRPKTAKYVHFMNMAKIWHFGSSLKMEFSFFSGGQPNLTTYFPGWGRLKRSKESFSLRLSEQAKFWPYS